MTTGPDSGQAADLRAALAAAARDMGLDAEGAQLIRWSVNAVYRLVSAPVVARIGIGVPGLFRGPRLVGVARWLTNRNAPTVGLVDGPQPVIIDDRYAITFWHELAEHPRPWTARDLATPLHALHRLVPDTGLPDWDPFGHARRRLAAADPALPRDDLEWLTTQWKQVEQQYQQHRSSMTTGVIHGDPHVGNLLADPTGQVVLCDLDGTGIGPLVWDLVPQAVGARRFNRAEFYRDFVDAYGFDVTTTPYWPVLARIRELIAVTSVLPHLSAQPAIAEEHAHRLHTLKTEQSDATWHLYR